jgi:hypothetical protein
MLNYRGIPGTVCLSCNVSGNSSQIPLQNVKRGEKISPLTREERITGGVNDKL